MDVSTAPWREAELLPIDLDVQVKDGVYRIASRTPLKDHDFNMPRAFAEVAARQPEAPALHRREGGTGDWRTVSYGDLKRQCDGVTQWLIDQAVTGPVLMMGSNSAAMAAFLFGTLASPAISAPVSPLLALVGGDLGRLRHVLSLVRPAVVFIEDARAVAAAIDGLDLGDAIVITSTPEVLSRKTVTLKSVLETEPTEAVGASIEALKPEKVVQFMLTSGSTGLPKAVAASLSNLAANTAAGGQLTRLNWTDKVLNWMPWHHVAGAAVLRATLLSGGEFYIDDGKPMPGLFDLSIRNLKEQPVRYYVNVPLGYALLADALEADAELRRMFFSELRIMLFGGAALAQPVMDRIQAMAVAETGHRILMPSAYGATETTSGIMAGYEYTDRVSLGLPLPGTVIKLVPHDHRYELRIAGPSVTAGYLDDPARNAQVFDEEGFYRTGDLVTFVDLEDPTRGVAFAGRAAEEFKLDSGVWVSGGAVRDAALKALSPLIAEVAVCDDNRPYLGLLAWPSPDGVARELGVPVAEALQSGALTQALKSRLISHNAGQKGSSSRIARLGLLLTPPNPNAHELSDKGTVNRRAVLDNRPGDLEALYADPPGPLVVVAD